MRKILIKAWFAVLFVFFICRPSFAEDTYKFTSVCGYNGEIYCNYSPAVYGVINEDICNPLPYGTHDLGCIRSFTIYKDHIYYMTSELGTGSLPASIYRCDMDGSNNVLIADDTCIESECYIVNDILYYSACYFVDYTPQRYDISCVNLNDFSHKTILTDTYMITHCDGKYIFFAKEFQGNFCRSDINGKNICRMSENDVEIFSDIIYGNNGYKLYDGAVYKYDWSGKSTWLLNASKRINGFTVNSDIYSGAKIENIIDGKVYYRACNSTWSWNYCRQNILLFRCNLDGTNHELVAGMFHP